MSDRQIKSIFVSPNDELNKIEQDRKIEHPKGKNGEYRIDRD